MAAFISNGLLGSVSSEFGEPTLLSNGFLPPPSPSELEDASLSSSPNEGSDPGGMTVKFGARSTGVLGSTEREGKDSSKEPEFLGTFDFQSNGLLGGIHAGTFESTNTSSSKEAQVLQAGSSTSTELLSNGLLERIDAEGLDFQSNGLLGETSIKTTDSSQNSVDNFTSRDELPTVPELLGVSAGPREQPRSTSASTSRPLVRAMTFEGRAMFFRRKLPPKKQLPSTQKFQSVNLLEIPIHRLLNTLSDNKVNELQKEASHPPQVANSETPEEELWVDRYRPRKFTDLLGNERVARDAMAWVKQWDWCVFGRSKKASRRVEKGSNESSEDEYHRPREKFLLLSGPPGLGKTTLAHVIARQAGYEVMEINASDARSGHVVEDRIRPTLEAGSTVGSTKPVLLIIDEIDGATGSGENSNTFIHKLVQLTQVKPKKKQKNGKRETGASRPILRPIICICNDGNASSIAKLRPHALQIRFNKPSDIHTVRRLREICEIEDLKADTRALTTLVGVSKGDLRGCLNTLQFIKSKTVEVTETIIRKATIGMKESENSVQVVLNSIFSPLSKKRVKELGLTEQEEARYVGRLYQEIDGSGRENAIATGCFGHYATLRNYDANLSRHEKAGEWLLTFDLMHASMYADGDFTLTHYLPYFLVPFFPLFQERGGERVERNQADWDHLQVSRTNEEIYKSLSRGLRAAAVRHGGDFRHLGSTPVIQLEFAPLLNRILSPPLRPVNSQIIKPAEKVILDRLVHIMASLELRFVRERSEEGQLSYRLDPPIDVFVTYDGKRASDMAVSRYAVRHLVAGEVDAKLADRDSDVVEKGKRGKHQFFGQSGGPTGNAKRTRDDGDEDGLSPNKKAKVEIADIADRPPTDFFGRAMLVSCNQKSKPVSRKASQNKGYRISYKFAEGNSAAVRKSVKVGYFM